MTTAAVQAPARLGRFVLQMFRPHIYATYGLLWALALEGSAVTLSGGAWRVSAATAVRVVSVVLALLFLRMLDEQKDLAYDRVHHPDRPLVTGAITVAELRGGMAVITAVVVGLNAALSPTAVVLVLVALGYGLFLAQLERRSTAVRESLLLNLLVTYPVQLLLSCYLYASLAASGAVAADWRAVPLVLLFACVFLHFEFARKTAWSSEPGARLYSAVLGPTGSAALALGLAAGAVVCEVVLFRPSTPISLLPCLMAILPAFGGWRFFASHSGSWPLPLAMGFILGSYLSLVLQAAVAR
ncbi:hypothetical protein [Streptacidiphilus sp. EB103A]|uniref:hypothetical protein n=1 Tax=Streptacidiphilus sp. EB103A TaxID=3156275 RepID=UPI003515EE30